MKKDIWKWTILGIVVLAVGGVVMVSVARFDVPVETNYLFSHLHQDKQDKKEQSVDQVEADDIEEVLAESGAIDTSDWETYRNEEYGFSVRYPEGWQVAEEFGTHVASPVDCDKTPEKCIIVYVQLNNLEKPFRVISLAIDTTETLGRPSISESKNVNEDKEVVRSDVNEGGQVYIKRNVYIPIMASCYTTAVYEELVLKNGENFHFSVFYELPDTSISTEEAEVYCGKEIPDSVFDNIVESLQLH